MKMQSALWVSTSVFLVLVSAAVTSRVCRTAPSPASEKFVLQWETQGVYAVRCLTVRDKASKELLWQQEFAPDGKRRDAITCYRGQPVAAVGLQTIERPEDPPGQVVVYYSYRLNGTKETLLEWSRTQGMYESDRVVYAGTASPLLYAWYGVSNCWLPVEHRSGKGGLIIDGVWRAITFTNQAWTFQSD